MTASYHFALNHRVAPQTSLEDFFAMAAEIGVDAVEIRNDLPGLPIADGTAAADIRAAVKRHGLRIISINALQRFNDWSPQRAKEARALADYAKACGAEALAMCPVNDTSFWPSERDRLDGLASSLAELAPILAERGVIGLVEPLGFEESSLRLKQDAVNAIAGNPTFRLVHDTFHHAIAGEAKLFPAETGLVHISGVEDPALALSAMRDPHRVFVGPQDRLDNTGQLRSLRNGGYSGYASFEPFAETGDPPQEIAAAIQESIAFLKGA